MVELVDSLDSGSSVHYGRAGSSPASPTKKTVERLSLFLLADPWQKLCVPLKGMVFPKDRHFLSSCMYLCLLISVVTYLQKSGRRLVGVVGENSGDGSEYIKEPPMDVNRTSKVGQ